MVIPVIENSAAKSWIPMLTQGSPLTTVETIFSQEIKTISSLCLSEWDDRGQAMKCIHECTKAIARGLEHLDFSLPVESRKILEHYWQLFDTALQREKSLGARESERIRSDFRHACLTMIQATWCTDAAQSFYRILLCSDRVQKINKAQSWSDQFTAGAFYLGQLASKSSANREHAYGKILADTTEMEFRSCYQKVMEQRTALVVKLAERDPTAFSDQINRIDSKQQHFLLLSPAEQEIAACANYATGLPIQYWSDLENQIKLLHACISSKYPQGNTPQPSFAEVLETLEAQLPNSASGR